MVLENIGVPVTRQSSQTVCTPNLEEDLLPGKDFLEFKRKLIKEIDRVNREVEHISEVELLNKMGFPENWKSITKYHLK